MAVRQEAIYVLFEISVPALVDNSFYMFTYSSHSRGYHAYKDVWRPTAVDKLLICEWEETNEYNRNAVFIIFDDCMLKKVFGYVLFNWSKLAAKFQLSPNHHICGVVTGKQINRGAAFHLEIPIDYIFHGDSRVTTWHKKALENFR